MQSKYGLDMGFDADELYIEEDKKDSPSVSVNDQQTINENQTTEEDQVPVETSESPKDTNDVLPESSTPVETSQTTQEDNSSEKPYETSSESNSESENDEKVTKETTETVSLKSNTHSENKSDSWSGAKFLLMPITYLADIITAPFSGVKENVPNSVVQSKSGSEPSVHENFDEVDYQEHQKNIGSTNKILAATVDTVYGAATTSKECEEHTFQCKERDKLHKKTGGTENTEMVNVNVYLDKSGKPLLPGARKTLKKHAEAKQQTKKDYQTEMSPPSDAVSHARREFEIAHEFGKGEDEYDKAGDLIHTGKGVAELGALDIEQFEGITSQPGFVNKSPLTSFLQAPKKQSADKEFSQEKSIAIENNISGTPNNPYNK